MSRMPVKQLFRPFVIQIIAGSLLFFIGQVCDAGSSNSLLDISADGKLLACSNRDSGTVTIVDLQGNRKVHEVAVGAKPEGITFVGDSHRLAVAVYAEDKIVLIDADSGTTDAQIEVFDEPYGIVSDTAGAALYVTLDYPGQVVEIDVASAQVAKTIGAGNFLRGIAIAPDDSRLFVTEYYTTKVVAVDLKTGQVVDEWPGVSAANLARQIVVNPRRPEKAYLGHIRSVVRAIRGDGSIFPYVSVVDLAGGDGRRRKQIPMDGFLNNLVTSNPWEVAVSPDGRQFYAMFAGTNDMFACEVVDDDYTEIKLRRYMQLGNNPRAVRVSPDNTMFYVYNALDFNVVAYDAQTLQPKATITVCDNPLGEIVRTGKIHFYSALQPMVGRRWISCSSCHPDGEPDGRTWHNPEGLRNTQSFAGMAWTHPIHWSADRDEVQDFEHTMRGPLMQGGGLIRGTVQAQLGPPNKGLSAGLDALAAYSNSHKFTLSPHAKNGLSESAKSGREIFHAEQTQCAKCHAGPFFTDSRPANPADIVRHDVGTGQDDPGEKMGPAYDTPTLLGIYRTAPYLHHGKAQTLKEVLTDCNSKDQHGTTSQLSKKQIADLVEFLKSLPYEDPEPGAKQAGLIKIDG